MRIVVSSAGRFHSVYLARQLRLRGLLHHFLTAGLLPKDWQSLPPGFVSFCYPVNLLDRVYVKLRGDRVLSPSAWYTLRDGYFDAWAASRLHKLSRFDLFVGWANCSLRAMQVAQDKGAKAIIESGSMHIEVQESILQAEYDKRGAKLSPVTDKNRDTMLAEYSLADRICVPSEHVASSFVAKGIAPEKIIKVPYGVDYQRWARVKKTRDKTFQLLFVGQSSLQKGIAYLLEAWRKLGLPQAELVLVGNVSAECSKLVTDAALDDESIKLVGPVRYDKLGELYASASAFVLPSLQEGLAMVLGEAMACGLPVVATNVSGIGELATDGREAFVVPPRDVDALAAKIEALYRDRELCEHMGRLARVAVRARSWDAYAQGLVTEYEKVVKLKAAQVCENL